MKRRKIIKFGVIFIAILVPFCVAIESSENSKHEEQIFVFPSMEMEGLSAASQGEHMPQVEVVYRGQPKVENVISTTTSSSSEVITSTTRGKSFSLSSNNHRCGGQGSFF